MAIAHLALVHKGRLEASVLSHLVHHHGNAVAMALRQDVAHQRGLARTQEAWRAASAAPSNMSSRVKGQATIIACTAYMKHT